MTNGATGSFSFIVFFLVFSFGLCNLDTGGFFVCNP